MGALHIDAGHTNKGASEERSAAIALDVIIREICGTEVIVDGGVILAVKAVEVVVSVVTYLNLEVNLLDVLRNWDDLVLNWSVVILNRAANEVDAAALLLIPRYKDKGEVVAIVEAGETG